MFLPILQDIWLKTEYHIFKMKNIFQGGWGKIEGCANTFFFLQINISQGPEMINVKGNAKFATFLKVISLPISGL